MKKKVTKKIANAYLRGDWWSGWHEELLNGEWWCVANLPIIPCVRIFAAKLLRRVVAGVIIQH